MTKLRGSLLALGVCLTVASTSSPVYVQARAAEQLPRIDVRTDDTIGALSRELTGSNNDKWFDNSHGLWDPETDAPNPDVVAKVVRAGVGMIRFPGGTVANLYDWKRAIGPTAERGCQTDARADGGEGSLDSTYGPDEYLRVLDATGATPQIMVPMANETPADAADWVEYLNARVGTNPRGGLAWAEVRATNGHPEPYGVKYWEIGNEPDRGGQQYWRIADDPKKRLRQYAFGGVQAQADQRLARGCDRRPSASVSTGEPSQQLEVLYPPAIPRSQTIRIGGTAWSEVHDLSEAGPNAKVYAFDARSGRVTFGDGVHGAIPTEGLAVTADYVSGPKPGFVHFYRAMKEADPSIDVCSSWAPIREAIGLGSASFAKLMAEHRLADEYDCVLIHPYTNFAQDFGADDWVSARDGHDEHMLGEKRAGQLVADLQGEVVRYSSADAYVAVSEFGALWFGGLGQHPAYPHWETAMSHTTYMASQWVRFAQLGLPWVEGNTLISEAPTGLRAVLGGRPEYVFTADATAREQLKPLLAAGGTTVRTTVADNPQLAPEQPKPGWGTYDVLAASASTGQDGALRIVVVNRHPTESVTARVAPNGFAHQENVAVSTVAGDSFTDHNSSEHPDDIRIVESTTTTGTDEFDYTFSPASITVLTLAPQDEGS
jgi:alpha-N-arabinofuranosidase